MRVSVLLGKRVDHRGHRRVLAHRKNGAPPDAAGYFLLRHAGEGDDDLVGDLLARTEAAARSIADSVPADVGGFISFRAGHAGRGAKPLARGQGGTTTNTLSRGFYLWGA